MVVIDATVLMLLFHPDARPPIDPETGEPVARCKERIELLLQNLSEGGIKIMVPTPVLSELLVRAGKEKARILSEIHGAYAFTIQPFDARAAIEVAFLTDEDLQSGRKLSDIETKAKVKYDRQIIAIAKVNGVKTIYTDDRQLASRAAAQGIQSVSTADLPLPEEHPQHDLPFDGENDDDK